MDSRTTLQARWTELCSETLPTLARARDPVQSKWPVTLDHCNTVGEGREQWDRRLKKPAVRHMSDQQLDAAIDLGGKIRKGDVDLVALDMQSWEARGKGDNMDKKNFTLKEELETRQARTTSDSAGKKRKYTRDDGAAQSTTPEQHKCKRRQSTLPFASMSRASHLPSPGAREPATTLSPDLKPILYKIAAHPTLTPYRKRLYSTLCSVPRGRYTTYAAMSLFLNSSARAVGNGMRNNPFAPEVPCHRVLAADGSIGGFCGSWGKDGEHASKKVKLLRDEGIRFNGKGKVAGEPFREFRDLSREDLP